MHTELYYFSGTGNTYYIAKKIANSFPDSKLIAIGSLDLELPIKTDAQNIGILFPVYFYDAPKIVKRFLEKIELSNNPYVFLIANYGGGAGNALANCVTILKSRHIEVSTTMSFTLPDNSIIFPTPEEKMTPMLEKADHEIEKAIHALQNQEQSDLPSKKLGAHLVSKLMLKYSTDYLGFNALKISEDKCTNCGLCSKICPVNNIATSATYPQMNHNCEMCFACLHHCPEEAIRFKHMKPKTNYQYTNPNVKLKELLQI
ncbi:EFR1 family ferrodoxin [Fusibacter ferrireducens]|uniref:4Fe-4S dicluster domain-containing protein n=1 Tax=Fusibacter ferrireducens TaxID=2785058 RepID=A0ABR9ZSR0_9FIRM|nr:EFR1 family ferrodoxin [Fusibacter ferrireducens]MBF4693494.1 4Fe-4S dicluster domain-containing protein [Fusibacter ferrireducens]